MFPKEEYFYLYRFNDWLYDRFSDLNQLLAYARAKYRLQSRNAQSDAATSETLSQPKEKPRPACGPVRLLTYCQN